MRNIIGYIISKIDFVGYDFEIHKRTFIISNLILFNYINGRITIRIQKDSYFIFDGKIVGHQSGKRYFVLESIFARLYTDVETHDNYMILYNKGVKVHKMLLKYFENR